MIHRYLRSKSNHPSLQPCFFSSFPWCDLSQVYGSHSKLFLLHVPSPHTQSDTKFCQFSLPKYPSILPCSLGPGPLTLEILFRLPCPLQVILHVAARWLFLNFRPDYITPFIKILLTVPMFLKQVHIPGRLAVPGILRG